MKINRNRHKYLFTATAKRGVKEREVQITDDSKESAILRLSNMNQYWTIDEKSVKKETIKPEDKTIFC